MSFWKKLFGRKEPPGDQHRVEASPLSDTDFLIQSLPLNDTTKLDASVSKLKAMGPEVAFQLCEELERLLSCVYTDEALDQHTFNIVKAICKVLPELVHDRKETFSLIPNLRNQNPLDYAFLKIFLLGCTARNSQLFMQVADAMIAMSPYAADRLRREFNFDRNIVGYELHAYVLSRLKDVSILEPLIRKVDPIGYPDFYVDCLAAYGKDYTTTFVRFLSDNDEYVRMTATMVLGQIGDSQSIDPLISALHDKEDGVRSRAISALGNYAGHFDANILLPFLNDESPLVQKYAIITLKLIDPSLFGRELEFIINDESRKDFVRKAAQEAMNVDEKRKIDHFLKIINLCNSPYWLCRKCNNKIENIKYLVSKYYPVGAAFFKEHKICVVCEHSSDDFLCPKHTEYASAQIENFIAYVGMLIDRKAIKCPHCSCTYLED